MVRSLDMSRTLRASALLGSSIILGACAAPHVPVATSATPASQPKTATTSNVVRWSFDHEHDEWVRATRAFDDGVSLWMGTSGRRAMRTATGVLHATMLLDVPLVGVVREVNGDFAFVDADGGVHVSKEPLGPFVESRQGPLSALPAIDRAGRVVAVGKSAILAFDRYGVVHRSTDAGRTWSAIPIVTVPRPLGGVIDAAASDAGEVLLLLDPQTGASSRSEATARPSAATGSRRRMPGTRT